MNDKIPISIPFYRLIKKDKNHSSEQKNASIRFIPELVLVVVLIISLLYWPNTLDSISNILEFILWCVILLLFFTLSLTNIFTYTLPNKILKWLFLATLLFKITKLTQGNFDHVVLFSILGSALLGGVLLIVYLLSRGSWIGGGDVRLGFIAGLFLGVYLSVICLALYSILFLILMLYGYFHKNSAIIPSSPIWSISIMACFIIGNSLNWK